MTGNVVCKEEETRADKIALCKEKDNYQMSVNQSLEQIPFLQRHIGPSASEQSSMLSTLGYSNISELIQKTIPAKIRLQKELALSHMPQGLTESGVLDFLLKVATKNKNYKTYSGNGYYPCITPPVIARNIFENPCWYTQYTPYQPEISQGRLESLFNFQTVVSELTGLPVANASLLDEATAAAEAVAFSKAIVSRKNKQADTLLVSDNIFSQNKAVLETRANASGTKIKTFAAHKEAELDSSIFAVLVQYPAANGAVENYEKLFASAREKGIISIVVCDLLSLCLLKPPGELGADVAVGSAQRFGVPVGFGGPSAAFFTTRDEFKRLVPGRIVGLSKDRNERPAYRLALQTREQHIRREKATSNICTAQVLLANMAAMYAVYHGPEGLKNIAKRVHGFASRFYSACIKANIKPATESFFDTLQIKVPDAKSVKASLKKNEINVYWVNDSELRVSFDETVTEEDFQNLLQAIFGSKVDQKLVAIENAGIPESLDRAGEFLSEEVFQKYRSETEFLRYVRKLESRDLSLAHSMIPLGSCTMKLNATAEMIPVGWKEFSQLHPFIPEDQCQGYKELLDSLEMALAEITGLHSVSLQPNAGSQGEYAGLLVIKAYHEYNKEGHRDICLIPKSAHGTNPASAVMAGLQVVVVDCDAEGNIDLADLEAKALEHKANLSSLMVTYPSTHGVFEEQIQEVCKIVHSAGGQVYMDGANLNAMVGLSSTGMLGADVVHINLHKTFCIPHGGGGPGMGPIAVAKHLADFLPSHPEVNCGGNKGIGPVSAAPYGSASILPISWTYMLLMGAKGLKVATEVAILNANYIAKRLSEYCPVLFKGPDGLVAHECIIDVRGFKQSAGIEVEDIAKRLIDYGFHSPTISFPVPGTMMIEPTESESLVEIDRFCEALISIFNEIKDIESGKYSREDNPLVNAPHTAEMVTAAEWTHPYSRALAAFPSESARDNKFWPFVSRIDGVFGDRNLICTYGGC